jgi:histidyl-tRNA synthetase
MPKWHFVERTIREVMELYNFKEIRTPTFEFSELFTRSVGEDTDIVNKEMYTFFDKGGNMLTLKPEMTAPVVRAYLENGLAGELPQHKLYYITNMFRYEKPQEGRYREHTQFGAEILGAGEASTDIEIILLAKEIYDRCGINNFKVKINSIGKLEERKKYIEILRSYLKKHFEELSDDSRRRLETNTLRILDSKHKADTVITKSAPHIVDHLSKSSRDRFDKVTNGLTKAGIEFEIDFRLVRGLDYYTDTTFEFISHSLGAQDAIGGGGRYDRLVESLGGKAAPGIGFGSGIERVIMAAERNHFAFSEQNRLKLYFAALTDEARELAVKTLAQLRKKNICCEMDHLKRSFKAQLREANKLNAEYVFIVGEEELEKSKGILKKMSDGSQIEVEFEGLREKL